MFTKAVDDGLNLILLTPQNADELYALIVKNRDHLHPWMEWPPETKSVKDTQQFIKTSLEGLAEHKEMVCGIEWQGHIAGVITFNRIHHKLKKVELGYWVGKEQQGKGLVTRCINVMIDYAFNELHMEKVEIHVATGNVPSQNICKRLGFQQEGIIRNAENLHGNIVDHLVLSLIHI